MFKNVNILTVAVIVVIAMVLGLELVSAVSDAFGSLSVKLNSLLR